MCDLSPEQVREYRGTLTEPGADSPFRHRSVAENLDLFQRMRAGEFPDGSRTLRAKIDMASPNLNMRDPVLYRIKHESHHRTGDAWCIYPMYDYAHPLSDALEGITHSICTMEYEDHRVLYDWAIENCPVPFKPRQYEFARLNLSYTVMSKRKLLQLVNEEHVGRLGRPPHAHPGGDAAPGLHPGGHPHLLRAHRGGETGEPGGPGPAGILRPGGLELPGAPGDGGAEAPQGGPGQLPGRPGGGTGGREQPRGPGMGTRMVPFSRELYVEREDFMEDPPKKFFRLAPGREVRLRYAYFIKCQEVVKDPVTGEVVELRCTYDPATKGGLRPGRPPGQGHPPLGVGGPGGVRRGASL